MNLLKQWRNQIWEKNISLRSCRKSVGVKKKLISRRNKYCNRTGLGCKCKYVQRGLREIFGLNNYQRVAVTTLIPYITIGNHLLVSNKYKTSGSVLFKKNSVWVWEHCIVMTATVYRRKLATWSWKNFNIRTSWTKLQ